METASDAPGQDSTEKEVQDAVLTQPELPPAAAPAQLREEQIQNALSFLAHPKVRSAPDESKRSFLEKKGLTEAEIKEAFRRVPSAPVLAPAAPSSQGLPPAKPYLTATVEAIQPLQVVPAQQAQAPQPIRWTQVAIGVGLIAATAYGLQQYVLPHLLTWLRPGGAAGKVSEDKRIGEAVAAVIQKQTEEVGALVEVTKQLLSRLEEQARREEKGKAGAGAGEGRLSLQELRQELRSFSTTLQGSGGGGWGAAADELRELKEVAAELKASLKAPPAVGINIAAPRVRTGSANGAESSPLHTSRGSVSDRGLSSTANAPVVAPDGSWAGEAPAQAPAGEPRWAPSSAPPPTQNGADNGPLPSPPHPASYMEVLEMLEKGLTPSNVRTDIVDTPPNPEQPPPEARLKPRAKPWLRSNGAPDVPPAHAPAQGVGGPPAGAGTHGVPAVRLGPAGSPGGVVIQEVTEQAGGSGPQGTWRPPAVPRPSLPPVRPRAASAQDDMSEAGSASSSHSQLSNVGAGVAA